MEMNSADWAMMPGARKARYDTDPVLMTCNLLNVVPKISSHSAGCTIRVTSSVRSCCSFCISTIANAPTRPNVARTRCHPCGARTRVTAGAFKAWSTGTAGNYSAGTDFAETGRVGRIVVIVQVGGRIVAEHILERGAGRHLRLQVGGRAHSS